MAVTAQMPSGKAGALGAMGALTLRMEALQYRGEQLRGGRGETRLGRYPGSAFSSPSVSPTSPAPPPTRSVPSYMASTRASRSTLPSAPPLLSSSAVRQTGIASAARSAIKSSSAPSATSRASVRSSSASKQSEVNRSSIRSSSGSRQANLSSSGSSLRSSSASRQSETSTARTLTKSSSFSRQSEMTSRSTVSSSSSSRQSKTTSSTRSLSSSSYRSRENIEKNSRDSFQATSRESMAYSSKENLGYSGRERSSSRDNTKRSGSSENVRGSVLGARDNLTTSVKRRSSRSSTMPSFGGYWPVSAPPSFNSQATEPAPGGKRANMLPPKPVSSSRDMVKNSDNKTNIHNNNNNNYSNNNNNNLPYSSSSKEKELSNRDNVRSREVAQSTKKRSVRASTMSSLSEWSSSSMVRNSSLRSSARDSTNNLRESSRESRDSRISVRESSAVKREASRESVRESKREPPLPPRVGPARSISSTAASRENIVSSKKKSVRASTMSSLRELSQSQSVSRQTLASSGRDRSWGRSTGQLKAPPLKPVFDNRGSSRGQGPGSAPLESPRLSREVLAKLGNRQTKVVNHPASAKLCAACQKPLTDDGFFAMGQLFHQACFKCQYCKTKLSKIFFTRNDQPCCAKCHKEASDKCEVCQTKITEDHIQVNKKFFHPRCMKCQVCGEIQTSRYLTYKDLPICEDDYKAIGHSCEMCDAIITGELFTLEGRVLCQPCNKEAELAEFGSCPACGETLSATDSLSVAGVTFHHGCLTCVVCEQNMEGKPVTLDTKNKVYCVEDYTKQFSVICAGCKTAIVPKKGQTKSPRMRALDRDYHLECFKCKDCSLVLQPGVRGKECWPVKKHLLCYKCYRRRQSESEVETSDNE